MILNFVLSVLLALPIIAFFTLAERKVIEHAKGLLMSSRHISEKEAYALIRETAMNQNKRVVEIAETIISMAEMLKAP